LMVGQAKDLVGPGRKIFNALVRFEDVLDYSYTEIREAPANIQADLEGQVVAELRMKLKHGMCELYELDPNTVTTER
jgi:hypothetical protein